MHASPPPACSTSIHPTLLIRNTRSPCRHIQIQGIIHAHNSLVDHLLACPVHGLSPACTSAALPHLNSQNSLVDHLVATGAVHSARVADVMRHVDRRHFIGPHEQHPFTSAYLVGG